MRFTARLLNSNPDVQPPDQTHPTTFTCIGHDRSVVTQWARLALSTAAPTVFVEITEHCEELVSVLRKRPVVTVARGGTDTNTSATNTDTAPKETITYETVETIVRPYEPAGRPAGSAAPTARIAQSGDGSAAGTAQATAAGTAVGTAARTAAGKQ